MIYTIYTMLQHLNLNDKDKRAFALIRNKIAHYGESPTLREINDVTGGKSPRALAADLLGELEPLQERLHAQFRGADPAPKGEAPVR